MHRLLIPEHIRYRVALHTYQVLRGNAPRYLGPLFSVAHLLGRQALRSASTNRLVAPSIKLSTAGIVGPFRWLVLRSGIIYRRKLRLRSRCRFSASDSKIFPVSVFISHFVTAGFI
jgi:hypothetical protein